MSEDLSPRMLLLSSNLRRRYAEDVLTTLALPKDSVLQFRYDAEYVAPTLQRAIANQSIVRTRALVGFVADVDTEVPFLVPVRLASVVQAGSVADMFVLRLRVGEYVNLEDFPLSAGQVREAGKRSIDKIVEMNGGRYYPAVSRFPDLRLRTGSDPQHWLGIARRLAQHPTFEGCYFARVDSPILGSGKSLKFDALGRLSLPDRKSGKLSVSFYSERYSDSGRTLLSCSTDGTFLRISSDDTYDVGLRYDTVEFWLQPATTAFEALGRVTIRLGGAGDTAATGPPDPLTTNVRFPVIVRRSKPRLLARVFASGAGAFLIALPAILGQHSSLRARVLASILGAALLSYATIVTVLDDK
jgi:hypothetical protein